MGITASTSAQLKTFENRIRSYTTDASTAVNDYKAPIYVDFAPADAPLPHIILSKGFSSSDPDVGDLREVAELDVVVRGRARMDEPKVNALADIATQALLNYRSEGSSSHGLVSVLSVRRGRIDFADLPSVDEVIELPLVVEFFAWPTLFTDALT